MCLSRKHLSVHKLFTATTYNQSLHRQQQVFTFQNPEKGSKANSVLNKQYRHAPGFQIWPSFGQTTKHKQHSQNEQCMHRNHNELTGIKESISHPILTAEVKHCTSSWSPEFVQQSFIPPELHCIMGETSLNYGITTTPYEPSTLSNTPMPTATDSTEQALNGLETLGANQELPSTRGKPQLRGTQSFLRISSGSRRVLNIQSIQMVQWPQLWR